MKAAPGTDAVVRGAARIAARVEAELHVVHVSPTDALRSADHAPLGPLRGLAEQLGARWTLIHADDPVTAIMRLASELQITQLVLGPATAPAGANSSTAARQYGA